MILFWKKIEKIAYCDIWIMDIGNHKIKKSESTWDEVVAQILTLSAVSIHYNKYGIGNELANF